MFSSTFKPLLNLNRTLPGHEPMVQFYVQQISWTKHKVWFCIQQNSGRTELNRISASLIVDSCLHGVLGADAEDACVTDGGSGWTHIRKTSNRTLDNFSNFPKL